MGFIMPSVRILDNMQLPGTTYVVRVKEVEAARGQVRPNALLVMDPRGERIALQGEETIEPTFGLPAMWVDESMRDEAMFRGYTVVDPEIGRAACRERVCLCVSIPVVGGSKK